MTAPLLQVHLSGTIRIVLSVLGGIFAVAMFESLAAIFMLLRFGLAGWARDAWSLRRRWYLPMLAVALFIYGALLLLGLAADPSKLHAEMLAEKRPSISICLTLTVVAIFIGIGYYRRSSR